MGSVIAQIATNIPTAQLLIFQHIQALLAFSLVLTRTEIIIF